MKIGFKFVSQGLIENMPELSLVLIMFDTIIWYYCLYVLAHELLRSIANFKVCMKYFTMYLLWNDLMSLAWNDFINEYNQSS